MLVTVMCRFAQQVSPGWLGIHSLLLEFHCVIGMLTGVFRDFVSISRRIEIVYWNWLLTSFQMQ